MVFLILSKSLGLFLGVSYERKAFIFNGLAIWLDGVGRLHGGWVGYSYIHSYTHGVKLNVNQL